MLRDYVPALRYGEKIGPGDLLGVMPGQTVGNIYYVMATSATDYADFEREYNMKYRDASSAVQNTIDGAIGNCTASKNDHIVVAPGHTENVISAAAIACDIAGVSIFGLGNLDNRPTLTFTTDTTADINISAQNVRISNFVMVAGVDSLGMFLDVDINNFQVDNCKFEGTSSYQAVNFINLATTYDDFNIIDCDFIQDTDPAGTNAAANTGGIYLVDSENIKIKGCYFHDQIETANVHNKTTACKNLIIEDTCIHNTLSDSLPLLLVAGAEGYANNVFGSNEPATDATEAKVWGTLGTKFWLSNNCSMGNDSGGGGQMGITGVVAT